MLKLIMATILSLSSLTAFADGHTKDAQRITEQEKIAKVKKQRINELRNVISFPFEFSEYSVDYLIGEINAAVKEGDKKIIIKFDSGGGSVFAGFKLIHRILELQKKGVEFVGVVDRACMSMCFMTYQFMDVRLAYPLAILMDHPASGGADHILSELTEILRGNVRQRLVNAKNSLVAIKMYELLVLNDFYMNVLTAKQLGLLDMVVIPGDERKLLVKKAPKKEVKKPVKK